MTFGPNATRASGRTAGYRHSAFGLVAVSSRTPLALVALGPRTEIPVCTEECKDYKTTEFLSKVSRSIDEYTEKHNIAKGIVTYSFVSRYSCLEFNCVFLNMIHCFRTRIGYLQKYSSATVRVQYFVTLGKSETYKETKVKVQNRTVPYEYTLRNFRPPSQVRSRQAVGSWAGLTLGRRMQGLKATDFSRILR